MDFLLAKKLKAIRREIAFRLSFWYAIILIALFTVSFKFFFPYAVHNLEKRTDQELRFTIDEFKSKFASEGLAELDKEFSRQAHTLGESNIYQTVFAPTGRMLISSNPSHWKKFPLNRDFLTRASQENEPIITTLTVPGLAHKVRVAYVRLAPDKILRVALLLRHDENFLYGLEKALITTLALTLAAVILAGWLMLQQITRRVVAVTNTAISISSSSLDKRVPVSRRGDEIDHLAQAFNGMLDRIESLVKGLQEVTDNVAHDLKMPLSRIRIMAESLLTNPQAKNDVQEITAGVIEESDRLLEMINTTHEIKAIETGIVVWNLTKIDLGEVVREVAELFQLSAEDKNLTLCVKEIISFTVKADLSRLQRVFANLLDNAIKYTPAGGKIEVTMRAGNHEISVEISDTGTGIASEALPRIFERFYRGDKSRTTSGLGLGLSLAESIVKAHGGKILVESNIGKGSTFIVVLPD